MAVLSLFDPLILEHINCSELIRKHVVHINFQNYLALLKQLTVVGKIEQREFDERFSLMASCLDTYFIVVLEDATTSRIIGAATLFIELKFIHQCSKVARGHIEDVIVDSRYRGMNFGRLLVDTLVRIGKHMGCYKISLDCSNEKVGFYEKLGFQCKNNIMYIRFDED
ncbi:unnamed protein product [Schistosoma margrebowiei]|uniref:Glucosamine 6-phosphate N-acetyltransferase n=1 Tax=Schistosoma margrebowiei TaxID=48269 RepID=A0A183MPT7_9TREM|nr:unnamed protein product [Schistosoma margrebowiei]